MEDVPPKYLVHTLVLMANAEYIQCLVTLMMTVVATILLAAVYTTKFDPFVTSSTRNYRAGQLSHNRYTEDDRKSSTRPFDGWSQGSRNDVPGDIFFMPNKNDSRESMKHSPASNSSSAYATADTMHPDNGSLPCSPRKNVAFLKTHKTGSSTIQNIIYRFGDNHDLNFALPVNKWNYFGGGNKFLRRYVTPLPRGHQYNILANHAVWNREEFHVLMPPDTVYLTILRHPATQYESLYTYYHWKSYFGVSFEKFVEDPQTHYRRINKATSSFPKHGFRNPSLYDLGMVSSIAMAEDSQHEEKLFDGMIQSLERDFHLVLILEYIEESIILLRNLLCWSWDDIFFFRVNARTKAGENRISSKSEKKLIDFNKGDWMLYKHFNDTLWRKVSEYGVARMQRDKLVLRQKIEAWRQFCIGRTKHGSYQGTAIEEFELTTEAKSSSVCKQLVRGAKNYLSVLNKKMSQLSPI